ncbi:MAG: cupredoxin domain-containing protein [Coriobacteriia bacterium]
MAERERTSNDGRPAVNGRRDEDVRYLVVLGVLVALIVFGVTIARANAARTLLAYPNGAASQAAATSGETVIADGVQSIHVDVSTGVFVPSTIIAKTDVPLKITYSQGSGCISKVMFKQFGIVTDISRGGTTVKIPALHAGEYPYSCGMEMIFARIIAR